MGCVGSDTLGRLFQGFDGIALGSLGRDLCV